MCSLNAVKFICVNKALFFLEEKNGVFGKIDSELGDVKLYENTPDEILGKEAYDTVLGYDNENIYIIYQHGKSVMRFCITTCEFEKIISMESGENEHDITWAGNFKYEDIIYLFAREKGVYFTFDKKKKILERCNTGISEKIMWICVDDNSAYMLSWDYKTLYHFDLVSRKWRKKSLSLDNNFDIKSKRPTPLHTMKYDEGYLYLLDAKNVIRIDVDTMDIKLLYINNDEDNGVCILVTSEWVIIPPLLGEKNIIIDKKNGIIYKTIKIPKDIIYRLDDIRCKVGIPCESDSTYYLPLIASDSFLSIDKDTMNFKFTKLVFNKDNLENVMGKIVRSEGVKKENTLLNLEQFISLKGSQ